jgi:hypothetical protein
MGQAVDRSRTFPFREHMTLSERQEYDWLTARYRRGERLQHFEEIRRNVLAARVVLPPEREPPSVA